MKPPRLGEGSACCAPTLHRIPWHLPYNWGKISENFSQGNRKALGSSAPNAIRLVDLRWSRLACCPWFSRQATGSTLRQRICRPINRRRVQSRSLHCDPLTGRRVWVSTPSLSWRTAVCDFWWRTWVREEIEFLSIHVLGVAQLRSGQHDQDPTKDHPPTPTSLYQWRERLRCRRCNHSPNTAGCECQWSCTAPKGPMQCKRYQRFGYPAHTHPGAPQLGLPPLQWMIYHAGTASVLWLLGKPHGDLPCLCKWKEAKAAIAKHVPKRVLKSIATGQPAPKSQRAGPSAEHMGLGEVWNHVVRWGVSSRLPPLHPPNHIWVPLSQSHASEQPRVTTRKRLGLRNLGTNLQQPVRGLLGSSRKQSAPSVKTAAFKPTTPTLWSPSKHPPAHSRKSDLDQLPLQACVEWLVGSSLPSPLFPQGQHARGLSWRPLFCLWHNMAVPPRRTGRCKALRLTC